MKKLTDGQTVKRTDGRRTNCDGNRWAKNRNAPI